MKRNLIIVKKSWVESESRSGKGREKIVKNNNVKILTKKRMKLQDETVSCDEYNEYPREMN